MSLQLLPANWHQSCIASTNYCAMQFLALSFSAQAHVLRRLHERTSILSPVAEHYVSPPNPLLPVTAHCQQPRIRSVWLLCCLATVAMETFFKGGLGQKKGTRKGMLKGEKKIKCVAPQNWQLLLEVPSRIRWLRIAAKKLHLWQWITGKLLYQMCGNKLSLNEGLWDYRREDVSNSNLLNFS